MEREDILEHGRALFEVITSWINKHTPEGCTNLDMQFILIVAITATLYHYWEAWKKEE